MRACVRACASARMSMHLRRTLTSRPRAATSVAISTFLCPDLNMCSAASRSCCHNQAKTHITKIAQHGTGRLRVGWSTSSSQRRGKQLLRQSIRGIESAVGPKAPLWAHRPGQARSVSKIEMQRQRDRNGQNGRMQWQQRVTERYRPATPDPDPDPDLRLVSVDRDAVQVARHGAREHVTPKRRKRRC